MDLTNLAASGQLGSGPSVALVLVIPDVHPSHVGKVLEMRKALVRLSASPVLACQLYYVPDYCHLP